VLTDYTKTVQYKIP